MKKLCKTLIALVLTLICTGVAFGANVKADEKSGDFEYKIKKDGTIMITSYTGSDNIVTIPEEIDGIKVTSLGAKCFDNWYVEEGDKKLIISSNVNSINKETFKFAYISKIEVVDSNKYYYVKKSMLIENKTGTLIVYTGNAEKISIPNGVKRISEYAFWRSIELRTIYIPKSVTAIEDGFWGNTSLEKIKISSQNKKYKTIDGVLFNKKGTKLIYYPEGLVQPYDTYYVPEGVKKIGKYAFDDVTSNLKNIYLSEGVTTIEENAFVGCQCLEYVYIPKSVKNIHENTFDEYNEKLTIVCDKSSNAWNYVEVIKASGNRPFTCEEPILLKNAEIKLEKTEYIYNGKEKNPKVEIIVNGKKLIGYPNYVVEYVNNKNIGKATVFIKGLGKYVGCKVKFDILPRKVEGLNIVSNKSTNVKLTWKKSSKVTGYEVYRSNSKNGTYKKVKTIKNNTYTDKKLKSKNTYYYKVRAYKNVSGKKVYSLWCLVKSVIVK